MSWGPTLDWSPVVGEEENHGVLIEPGLLKSSHNLSYCIVHCGHHGKIELPVRILNVRIEGQVLLWSLQRSVDRLGGSHSIIGLAYSLPGKEDKGREETLDRGR